MEQVLLRIEGVAEALDVNVTEANEIACSRGLASVRINGALRVPLADLEEVMRGCLGDLSRLQGRREEMSETSSKKRLPSLWLTVSEVSELLNLSRQKIYTMISSGELPSVRISRRTLRVSRVELDAWIAMLTQTSTRGRGET